MMDFSALTALTIPEGAVSHILRGGDVIWSTSHLFFKLSDDGMYFTCTGVRDSFDGTTVSVPASIAGIPVTSVGAGAFSKAADVTKVTFGSTPTEIAADAFAGCDSLATVVMPGALDVLDGSPWGSAVVKPRFEIGGVVYRGHNTAATKRYVIDGLTSAFPGGAIEFISSIGGMPVYELNGAAFRKETSITEVVIPASVKAVEGNVFNGCTGLTTVTFKGTPSSIPATAFANCTNLLTINVPWAEDAVENAPWGATNATIHYNNT